MDPTQPGDRELFAALDAANRKLDEYLSDTEGRIAAWQAILPLRAEVERRFPKPNYPPPA